MAVLPPYLQASSRYPTTMPATNSSNLCQVCGIKPKYVDATGNTHSYCGKTCARNAVKGPSSGAAGGCMMNGCKKPQDPLFNGFCSSDHAKLAVSSGVVPGCTRCHVLPQCNGKNVQRLRQPAAGWTPHVEYQTVGHCLERVRTRVERQMQDRDSSNDRQVVRDIIPI
ncbi:hypothetical protein L210DRAFT_2651968 [Boletus edulis BED1]|uniref:Uncharacterized protein n=1 Tax=Boletus edulis BED1 TaxID=1328754 RepID=A0AAD4C543_BOLED|nr:hypothetical protein L210DRAFT_2651968 [Boletus edulis BED1]